MNHEQCTSSLSHTCHGCLRNDSVTRPNPRATGRTCHFGPEYQGQRLASCGKEAREKEHMRFESSSKVLNGIDIW
jgi:hypothetical protein